MERDAGGVESYNNLDVYHDKEPGYSVYCALLRIRWASALMRNLGEMLAQSEEHLKHEVRLEYFEDNQVTEITFAANKFTAWFVYTAVADTIMNLWNAHDYLWSGLVRAYGIPGSYKGNLPPPPHGQTRGLIREYVAKHIRAPEVDQVAELYCDTVKPWKVGRVSANDAYRQLHRCARYVRHNQLPRFDIGVNVSDLTFYTDLGHSKRFTQDLICPGGIVRAGVLGKVTHITGRRYNEVRLCIADTDEKVMLPNALKDYYDDTRLVLLRAVALFSAEMWFAGGS